MRMPSCQAIHLPLLLSLLRSIGEVSDKCRVQLLECLCSCITSLCAAIRSLRRRDKARDLVCYSIYNPNHRVDIHVFTDRLIGGA
jgi:hypothetical protein